MLLVSKNIIVVYQMPSVQTRQVVTVSLRGLFGMRHVLMEIIQESLDNNRYYKRVAYYLLSARKNQLTSAAPCGHLFSPRRSCRYYYRKQWLEYQLKCFDQDANPLTKMNVYEAISWSVRICRFEVSNNTTHACFRKSNVIQSQVPTPVDFSVAIESAFAAVASWIYDVMSLFNFLNQDDENIEVEEKEEITLRDIIAAHIMPQLEEDWDVEEDGPPDMIHQALKSLMRLPSFKYQEQDASSIELTILMRMERSLQ
ncbi:unnamed protein product [Blumeria hordei]|uniref:Uncharacterized protein n=1 Tax=Blumeria hordei TaxID=2867405 RepID=A0A383UKW1_BLUHO|nr:unnamed protein product [Blumeria hordei]